MKNKEKLKLDQKQKIFIAVVLILSSFMIFSICRYWYADLLYAKARNLTGKDPDKAETLLLKALKILPGEPLFHQALSECYTFLGKAELAISESQKAISLSPSNISLRKAAYTMYIRLAANDPKYIIGTIKTLEETLNLSPTDAKLYYQLGLSYARVGETDTAYKYLYKSIGLKPNYKEPRLATAYLLIEQKEYEKAKDELNYILTNIDPDDDAVKSALDEIR